MNRKLDNQAKSLTNLKNKRDALKESVAELQEQSEREMAQVNPDEEILARLKNQLAYAKKAYEEANQDLVDAANDLMDAVTDEIARRAEVWAREWSEALNGMFSDITSSMDMYNMQQGIDTFFLEEYDKTYELDSLIREVTKSMEDMTDPAMLTKYGEFVQRLNDLKEEGVQLTQTDLDILKAEFDLEQARDAYEDARQAKNTMRLARDASGNWSYVYSNDQDSTEDLEATLAEKEHNLVKMHRDAANAAADAWLQNYNDFIEYIKNIDQLRYEQDEKYRAEVEARKAQYERMSELYKNEIIKHNEAIDRSFTDMTLSTITKYTDMEELNAEYVY